MVGMLCECGCKVKKDEGVDVCGLGCLMGGRCGVWVGV